jgi:hypothetical protein
MATKVKIYSVFDWGAAPPKQGRENIELVPMAKRIIFHHTAGHHAEISDPLTQSLEESFRYARGIQAFHMRPVNRGGRGWLDSGHNFLVCRNGAILQGRHLTLSAIRAQMMVRSAHCPGQNDQIGIEHEHAGDEAMTVRQREASARLMFWIAKQYGKQKPLPVFPHSRYYATECPANLVGEIAGIKARAAELLAAEAL